MAPPRKFDHDEARARHFAGEKIAALAADYGVSWNAVWNVVTDAGQAYALRDRREEQRRRYRQPCLGGCGSYAWFGPGPHRSGYCPACSGLLRAESVDGEELRCSKCREWKPDEAFPMKRRNKARRGRHDYCRACHTQHKREQRAQAAFREREREWDRAHPRRKAAA